MRRNLFEKKYGINQINRAHFASKQLNAARSHIVLGFLFNSIDVLYTFTPTVVFVFTLKINS